MVAVLHLRQIGQRAPHAEPCQGNGFEQRLDRLLLDGVRRFEGLSVGFGDLAAMQSGVELVDRVERGRERPFGGLMALYRG